MRTLLDMQASYLIKMKKVKLKKGNRTIATDVEFVENMFSKGIGMMFRKQGKMVLVADNEGTLTTSIHTFFCAPLLIAWIDSKNKVVDVKKTQPFWYYVPKKSAKYVFETTDLNTKIKPGDKIKFVFS
jgi:uncharacterized membrane protein (UPF0127 family)